MTTQMKTPTAEAENVNRVSDEKVLIPNAKWKKIILFLYLVDKDEEY